MDARRLTAALCASFALATFAPAAHAGTYHVYSCRMPDGEAAPVDGWSGVVAPGSAYDVYAVNTCAEHGALVAGLGDATIHATGVDRATWTFTPPLTDRLIAATLWRTDGNLGTYGVNSTYQSWLAGPEPADAFDECIYTQGCTSEGDVNVPMSAVNRVVTPADNLGSSLVAGASCVGGAGRQCPAGKGDANGYAAAVYLYAADLTLEQNEGPHANNVSGELATAATIGGASDVAFDASDPGAGVYEAVFAVDGNVVQRTVLDENGGRCRNVGQTSDGTPAFLYLRPCVDSVSADVQFDTTRISNGTHHIVVSVLDAAGNAAPVVDRAVTIDNPPPPGTPGPPNGVNASTRASMSVRWNATRDANLRTPFGRAASLTGRLTAPGGAPIANALVEVHATPAYSGGRAVAMRSVRTDAMGRFTVRIPAGGSSRALRFAYRAMLGEAAPVATRTLRLTVQAGIALSVAPRTTSVGHSIFFRGRLLGGPVPASGKQLVLEARSPGSEWIEFDVVRTDARGRYHASYRFKFAGPADYTFRVRSEPESDYPFAAGTSDVIAVHER